MNCSVVADIVIPAASVVATLFLGIAALLLARNQTRAALFDRRFETYRSLAAAVADVTIKGAVYDDAFAAFREVYHRAKFLYARDVAKEVETLWDHAYAAYHLRPLPDRSRTPDEHRKAEVHMEGLHRSWVLLQPSMNKPLRLWGV